MLRPGHSGVFWAFVKLVAGKAETSTGRKVLQERLDTLPELSDSKKPPQEVISPVRLFWRCHAIYVELYRMRSAKYSQRIAQCNLIKFKELVVANEEAICQHRCCA